MCDTCQIESDAPRMCQMCFDEAVEAEVSRRVQQALGLHFSLQEGRSFSVRFARWWTLLMPWHW